MRKIPAKYDLTGKMFGKWTVLSYDRPKGKSQNRYWNCQCECGNLVSVMGGNLKRGISTQCLKCSTKDRFVTHGLKYVNGYSNWDGMMQRIKTSGRVVCDEWKDPQKYIDWITPLWFEGCVVHRINDDDPEYAPDKVQVISKKEHMKIHQSFKKG